jgi:hypothetical protein
VSFAAINLYVASRVFIVVSVYFVINSVRKLLDTSSHDLDEVTGTYLVRIWEYTKDGSQTGKEEAET